MPTNIPQGFTLLHTLRGHKQEINRIAWSPNGQILASCSFDGTIRLWNATTGAGISLQRGTEAIYSVAWSLSGSRLAWCGQNGKVRIERLGTIYTGHISTFPSLLATITTDTTVKLLDVTPRPHSSNMYDIAWLTLSSLASGAEDQTVGVWLAEPAGLLDGQPHFVTRVKGHSSPIFCLAYTPRDTMLASGSSEGPIRLWSWETDQLISPLEVLRGHTGAVNSMAWFPHGSLLASGSADRTVRIWNPRKTTQLRVLQGHTNPVTSVSFSFDGSLLASKSQDNTVRLWRTDTWETVAVLPETASNGVFAGMAFHPSQPVLATVGEGDKVIHLWQLDIPYLLGKAPAQPSVHYTNAKVVLVGESGVGKTALGMVLAGKPYEKTDSTHGRIVRDFDNIKIDKGSGRQEQRETFLWDLAGQIGYRPIHQLHLAEVAVALIVFSNNEKDPLASIPHWVRALRTAQNVQGNAAMPLKKILVEARVDRGRANVSTEEIQQLKTRWGLDGYIETSAAEGRNIAELRAMIQRAIDWDALPKVTSTQLFQRIKDFLVAQKEAGSVLTPYDTLYHTFLRTEGTSEAATDRSKEFNTCVGLIESQGLIRRLSFGGLILLKPELLDAYASALINVAREDQEGLGSVAEAKIRAGDFSIPPEVRLTDKEQEKLLLLAMIEDLLTYEIALREQGTDGAYLVFPLEVRRSLTDLADPQGKTIVFTFEGPVLNIYATLTVRLSHSGIFSKPEMWHNAVSYRANVGGLCGIALRDLRTLEEGRGELTLFFDAATSEETRFQFEDYVETHLERYALPGSLQRQRIFRCPNCQAEVTEQIVRLRRNRGLNWLICSVCDTRVDLRDRLERFTQEQEPLSVVDEIDSAAKAEVKREVAQSVVQGKIETRDFDVFLCHNWDDKPAVKAIGMELKEHGLLPWLDDWELRPGLPWQRVLEEQIEHIKAAAVFVGQSGMGPWQIQELEALLRQFVHRRCPVIPVILANVPQQPQLPIFLEGMTWVDFRNLDSRPLQRLIWGITGKKPPLL